MLPRFFAPALADRDDSDAPIALPPDEAGHLTRVLRLRLGAEIAIFDGRGREFVAIVDEAVRDRALVRPVRRVEAAPEPRVRLTLVQAVLKADKLDAIVRDATMMGVSVIRPAITLRGNAPRAAVRRPAAVERWQRIAIAAVKQCGRAVVPQIDPATDLEAVLRDDASEAKLMLAEPELGASDALDSERLRQRKPPASATLVIGPEGGWEPGEIDLARRQGFAPLTLGRRTLRADAAPLIAISVVQAMWGDL
jgi:16S rRNA (uracil1498-N3)-methyltransferase